MKYLRNPKSIEFTDSHWEHRDSKFILLKNHFNHHECTLNHKRITRKIWTEVSNLDATVKSPTAMAKVLSASFFRSSLIFFCIFALLLYWCNCAFLLILRLRLKGRWRRLKRWCCRSFACVAVDDAVLTKVLVEKMKVRNRLCRERTENLWILQKSFWWVFFVKILSACNLSEFLLWSNISVE